MNYLRNLFLILTALGAIISFYMKVSRDFSTEMIKIKYKNVPGKQGIFEVVTVYMMFSLFAIDIIALIKTVPGAITNGFNQTSTAGIGNVFIIIIVILAMAVLLNIILTPFIIYSKVSNEFKSKLENREFKKISKFVIAWNKVWSFVVICISTYCFYIILSNLMQYIKLDKYENNFIFISNIDVLTMKDIMLLVIILFICITLFIIQRSLDEIINAINDDYIYILDTENGPIECNIFLEYNEYYLLFKDSTEQYINKSKVKNITKKRLDEESSDKMKKISRYDKAIDRILDPKKYEEYKYVKEKIKKKYNNGNYERDIDLELERVEENIETVKAPIESYIFSLMSIIIPSIITIWIGSLSGDNVLNNIILTVAFLYIIVSGFVFIKKISNNDKHFQVLIVYKNILKEIKNGEQ